MHEMKVEEYVKNTSLPDEFEVMWEGNWQRALLVKEDSGDNNLPLQVKMLCLEKGEYGVDREVWLNSETMLRVETIE